MMITERLALAQSSDRRAEEPSRRRFIKTTLGGVTGLGRSDLRRCAVTNEEGLAADQHADLAAVDVPRLLLGPRPDRVRVRPAEQAGAGLERGEQAGGWR